jgi:hypothetical protein
MEGSVHWNDKQSAASEPRVAFIDWRYTDHGFIYEYVQQVLTQGNVSNDVISYSKIVDYL